MTILIAEVKTQSPFGYKSSKTWDELFSIARMHGDWISIHTDPRWGGSFDLIAKARGKTAKPILAKGIHSHDTDIIKALAHGATYVLVVGRIPAAELLPECLIEVNSLEELLLIPLGTKVVWNTRDLSTGKSKNETFAQARAAWSGWLCQASFIRDAADVNESANAILVGEGLERYVDSLQKERKK